MFFTNRISTTAFNISVQPERFVLGFAPRAGQKGKDANFVFDPFLLEQTRLWWETADSEPLCLNGPTGCGKTSFIREFLLRVNAPFVELTCHRRLDKSALLGGFVPTQKGFEWQDGPAARAWREGLVLVINEFSIAPPEVWVAANDILEGGDLYMLHDSIKYPPIDNRNDPPQLSKEVLSHAKKKEDHGLRCVQQWRIKNHDQTRRKSEDPAPDTR